jgi:hypothetical protein
MVGGASAAGTAGPIAAGPCISGRVIENGEVASVVDPGAGVPVLKVDCLAALLLKALPPRPLPPFASATDDVRTRADRNTTAVAAAPRRPQRAMGVIEFEPP